MASFIKKSAMIAALCLSLTSAAQLFASESGSHHQKDLKYVFQIGVSGARTPYKSFNKTVNPEDEPTRHNILTPLGSRQQFLVGTEFRRRYVDEQHFLNYSFDVEQMYLQSQFEEHSILSLQSAMLGMYPPKSSMNKLNEWQQKNAIPPLYEEALEQWEDYFTQWQAELGEDALLYNLNTFPINMYAANEDYLIGESINNCNGFRDQFFESEHILENIISPLGEELFPRLAKMFFNNRTNVSTIEAYESCDYLQWADLHNVKLSVKYSEKDLRQCGQLQQGLYQYFYLANNFTGRLGTNDLQADIVNKLESAQNNSQSGLPNYIFYMTTENKMTMLLSQLIIQPYYSNYWAARTPAVPASQLVFEVYEQDGQYYVSATYNDLEIRLGGCPAEGACELSKFTYYLNAITVFSSKSIKEMCTFN